MASRCSATRCLRSSPKTRQFSLRNRSVDDSYADALPVRRPSGHILLDGHVVEDTVQCVHCNGHYTPMKGSGIIRGFCRNCMGPVCSPKCAACVPFERWLDQIERGPRVI